MNNSILDKGQNICCSCGVCAVICPSSSIDIIMDEDGFYRPKMDEDSCKQCGLCKSVCYKYLPLPDKFQPYFHDKTILGVWSNDQKTVKNSTSGGVAHELISWGLKNGAVPCGAIFDPDTEQCKHILADTKEKADMFRGSKYLQSRTVKAFTQFQPNRTYVVVGTPCQIYGLRQYVRFKKWEGNFLFIDFFCHGTPSYLLWNKYRQFLKRVYNINKIKNIEFRSKDNNQWHEACMSIEDCSGNRYFEPKAYKKDLFYRFFLSNSCLNGSCNECLLRHDLCCSDIRLGDFWGEKYKDNDQGVSLVTLNTCKGESFFEELKGKLSVEPCCYEDLQNSQRLRFYKVHKKANKTMRLLKTGKDLSKIYKETIKPSVPHLVKRRVRQIIKKLLT